MRALLAPLALLAAAAVHAQVPEPGGAPADKRVYSKVERLQVDDGGTRVDELRVGGQVQNVTVTPKGELPAYELQPTDMARSRPADRREGFSGGSARVWNVFSF